MLDNLYENIGGKIKNLAKCIFIIETIAAILTGISSLIALGFVGGWWGLCIIIFGPVVAWISTWLLYAFGELAEDVHTVSSWGMYAIDELDVNGHSKRNIDGADFYDDMCEEQQDTVTLKHANQCECGELFYGRFCPVCGKSPKT